MAKGFAAGLIQGSVVCGAALVALSLALPQPPRPDTVATEPAAEAPGTQVAAVAPKEAVAPKAKPVEAAAHRRGR